MSLTIHAVRHASDGTALALEALRRAWQSAELLEPVHVVVPTVGMREWLVEQVMRHDAESFGVVMNVKFHFIGDLHRDLHKSSGDLWSVNRQVTALLPLLEDSTKRHAGARMFVSTSSGVLPAADRLAQLFDRYVSRRPRMMHQWEAGHPSDASGAPLAASDQWQFEVWAELRRQIGAPHPVLASTSVAQPPSHLLVFGVETLDERTLAALQRLSAKSEIAVIAIHPSPLLASRWDFMYPKAANASSPPAARAISDVPSDLVKLHMTLPYRWLRAAEEMQMTLAKAGLGLQGHFSAHDRSESRLDRIKSIIGHGSVGTRPDAPPTAAERQSDTDTSVVLHRCHGLARQAEVAVDAIVQALNDSALHDAEANRLQLHEIAIMSPNIKRMAPHLRAAFARKLVFSDGSECKIPLRLADLTLGDQDDGARVFTAFLELVGGRLDLDSVLNFLSDPSFVASRRLGPEAIQRWELHLTRARQRWGLNAGHRQQGFDVVVTDNQRPDEQHSWLHSIRRILLGATAERGGVEVLLRHGVISDVETDELEDVLELVELVEIIGAVVAECQTRKTSAEWALLLDASFSRLCGQYSKLTSVPLRQLKTLASLSGGEGAVGPLIAFTEVARYLTNQFGVIADKRLTRSGEIIASGMGAQSQVPYRVVCLVGVDDPAFPSGGRDGFDLASRENLVGDPDPRHDARRQLLSAVLAAGDRVIITCDGRDLKNNEPKNLAAPLDEFVSWCAEAGEQIPEVEHPRHLYSPRNFVAHGVRGSQPWSHDDEARKIATAMQAKSDHEDAVQAPAIEGANKGSVAESSPAKASRPQIAHLQLRYLGDMLFAPLRVFLRWSYNIYKVWENAETETALLPLELENSELAELAQELLQLQMSSANAVPTALQPAVVQHWKKMNRELHRLPVTAAAKDLTEELVQEVVASAVNELVALSATSLTAMVPRRLEIAEASIVLDGFVPSNASTTAVVQARFDGSDPSSEPATNELMLQMIFYRACGISIDRIQIVAMKEKFKDYVKERDENRKKRKPDPPACASFALSWGPDGAPTAAEASTWLAELVGLYRTAAELPVPTFQPKRDEPQSETAGHMLYIDSDQKLAREKFDEVVAKEATEYSSGFAESDEGLLYGAEPTFEGCFPIASGGGAETPAEQQFWLERHAWWPRPAWSKPKGSASTANLGLPEVLRQSSATARPSS